MTKSNVTLCPCQVHQDKYNCVKMVSILVARWYFLVVPGY